MVVLKWTTLNPSAFQKNSNSFKGDLFMTYFLEVLLLLKTPTFVVLSMLRTGCRWQPSRRAFKSPLTLSDGLPIDHQWPFCQRGYRRYLTWRQNLNDCGLRSALIKWFGSSQRFWWKCFSSWIWHMNAWPGSTHWMSIVQSHCWMPALINMKSTEVSLLFFVSLSLCWALVIASGPAGSFFRETNRLQ